MFSFVGDHLRERAGRVVQGMDAPSGVLVPVCGVVTGVAKLWVDSGGAAVWTRQDGTCCRDNRQEPTTTSFVHTIISGQRNYSPRHPSYELVDKVSLFILMGFSSSGETSKTARHNGCGVGINVDEPSLQVKRYCPQGNCPPMR
jgi:hypothetical protein